MFYELEYKKSEAQAILGRVIGSNKPIADPTWRLYRQKARKLCGRYVCPPGVKVIYASELSILVWIAYCRTKNIYQQLEAQSLFGSGGFPYQKAKKFAEKYGVCCGEVKYA